MKKKKKHGQKEKNKSIDGSVMKCLWKVFKESIHSNMIVIVRRNDFFSIENLQMQENHQNIKAKSNLACE